MRLDTAVYEMGFAKSRERAKLLITDGNVNVNGKPCLKPAFSVSEFDILDVAGGDMPFVSRGGFKLEKALESFEIELKEKICLDVGASTGGFTDCMLQRGAKKVYAIDAGSGQLDEKLRKDKRVINIENTNFRYFTPSNMSENADFACVDVSFISLRLILPVLKNVLKLDGNAVCLIKPQFETGRMNVGKKGIVKDKKLHIQVIESIIEFAKTCEFGILALDYSPVKGSNGNIEFLLYLDMNYKSNNEIDINETVNKSHINL